jgi:hypothetical protein
VVGIGEGGKGRVRRTRIEGITEDQCAGLKEKSSLHFCVFTANVARYMC